MSDPLMSDPLMSDPIQLQRRVISGTESGPHLLITGGVHGDEFESMAADPRARRQRGGLPARRDGVEAYVEGCLGVMASLGMIERAAPPSRVVHVVEDNRTDAGMC